MMPGGSQTGSVFDVVVLHDYAIHWIGIFLWIEAINRFADGLGVAVNIQKYIGHHGEAIALQKLLLRQLAVALQGPADQVKGKELQMPLGRLTRIQLSDAAGRQISWMGIGLLQTEIDFLKISPRDDSFATDFERFRGRYGQGHIQECSHRMGDILTDDSFPTAGNRLLQLALAIPKYQCQAVHLPGHHHSMFPGKPDEVIHGLGFICRQHRLGMPDRHQLLQNLSGHSLGGRAGQDQPGARFQCF